MAKKDRVPTPPKRPVQAPKAYRAEPNPRRSQLIFIAVAAAIVIAAGAVGIAFIFAGGDDAGGAVGDGPGNCQLQTFDALEASHVQELPNDYEYNSTPPTSGLHNNQTAIWNLYDQPVPSLNYVHNLEHGGVVVQYGSQVPDAAVAEIGTWYNDDTRGLIVAPLAADVEEEPNLADKVVLTSWTHMLTCTTFDEDAFDEFVDDYRGPQGDAPEKFPLDTLVQGGN
ncbi:MAG: DUF3105 domain-containing protein [Candidatus Rokuibacteriota bacterium]